MGTIDRSNAVSVAVYVGFPRSIVRTLESLAPPVSTHSQTPNPRSRSLVSALAFRQRVAREARPTTRRGGAASDSSPTPRSPPTPRAAPRGSPRDGSSPSVRPASPRACRPDTTVSSSRLIRIYETFLSSPIRGRSISGSGKAKGTTVRLSSRSSKSLDTPSRDHSQNATEFQTTSDAAARSASCTRPRLTCEYASQVSLSLSHSLETGVVSRRAKERVARAQTSLHRGAKTETRRKIREPAR